MVPRLSCPFFIDMNTVHFKKEKNYHPVVEDKIMSTTAHSG